MTTESACQARFYRTKRRLLHFTHFILPQAPLEGRRILRADQGLRRASTIRDVLHVAVVSVDHLVQMLATILAHGKAMHLFVRVFQAVA